MGIYYSQHKLYLNCGPHLNANAPVWFSAANQTPSKHPLNNKQLDIMIWNHNVNCQYGESDWRLVPQQKHTMPYIC